MKNRGLMVSDENIEVYRFMMQKEGFRAFPKKCYR